MQNKWCLWTRSLMHTHYEYYFALIFILRKIIATNVVYHYRCAAVICTKLKLNRSKTLLCVRLGFMTFHFIFSCDQAAIWLVQSVHPSVCLSVCPSHLFHHVPIIVSSWNFQELLPWSKVMSMQKVKVRGQRSRSQVNTQLSRFRTLTPAWIHIWQWNHAHSWKQHKRGALLFFKVIRQISRSHGSKNPRIWPRLGVSGL